MARSRYTYFKSKSLPRELIQKIFLKLLLKLFPKKFLLYKEKIRFIMNKSGFLLRLYLVSTYLRFRYPLYFRMPSTQLYAVGTAIKFLEIFTTFFLLIIFYYIYIGINIFLPKKIHKTVPFLIRLAKYASRA